MARINRGRLAGTRRAATAVALALTVALSISCVQRKAPDQPKSKPTQRGSQAGPQKADDQGGKALVLMMGRSVMGGWFGHWTGGSGATTVKKGGATLKYVEIAAPPQIADSVSERLTETGGKPIVFFKFCFDDFAGSSRDEAAVSLAEKKKYVEQVYQTVVKKHGLTLVVGNALPKVARHSDRWLVWNHRQYNRWLSAFAADHEGEVVVFDFYDLLSAPDGSLKSAYATNPEDSHPNEAGYKVLDEPMEQLLTRL